MIRMAAPRQVSRSSIAAAGGPGRQGRSVRRRLRRWRVGVATAASLPGARKPLQLSFQRTDRRLHLADLIALVVRQRQQSAALQLGIEIGFALLERFQVESLQGRNEIGRPVLGIGQQVVQRQLLQRGGFLALEEVSQRRRSKDDALASDARIS